MNNICSLIECTYSFALTHLINGLNSNLALGRSWGLQTLCCRHVAFVQQKRAPLAMIIFLEKDEAGHDNSYFSAKKEVNFAW